MCWSEIIGLGSGAGQGILSGQANASALEHNADSMDMMAADTRRRGAVAEETQRIKTDQLKGEQRAAIASGGVDVNTGTAAKVQEQTEAMGEYDALTIRSNALREAWGYEDQAAQMRAQALEATKMQRILMPGAEGGKVKDVLGQQLMGGNPFRIGKQRDYIATGKYNSGGVGSASGGWLSTVGGEFTGASKKLGSKGRF